MRRSTRRRSPPPVNTSTKTKSFHSEMKSIDERIAAWLGAISGSGGHNQTFRVACSLYNGWGLFLFSSYV